ncbi:BQ2448_2251 [Microbotryum intermedium]|uniref:BQ2448_2251 protein n=1 Tax=Microbotryum intermedium TaxID=269621 RepID=A0A238FAW8_9BASI|nr:BQ2448_2251 [Microbotryum intermedium]
MYDLPYAAKCSITNIYCYTKILYYNRSLPAPKNVVKEIQDAAMLAIHGRASDGSQRRPMGEPLYARSNFQIAQPKCFGQFGPLSAALLGHWAALVRTMGGGLGCLHVLHCNNEPVLSYRPPLRIAFHQALSIPKK